MKAKSAIIFALLIALIAGVGYLALFGASAGKYTLQPVSYGIKQGLDLRGGVYTVYQAADTDIDDFDLLLNGAIKVLSNRLTDKGFTEATVTKQGSDRIRIEIPNVDDPDEVLEIIGTPGLLEFKDPDGNTVMDGSVVKMARATVDDYGNYIVAFELNEEGTQLFADATTRLQGQAISITLDGEVKSSPVVENPITSGTGTISGGFTLNEANDLAMLIQSGAIPLELRQLEVRTISATLGDNALPASILAGIIGTIVIMLFMMLVYRLPGFVATLSLLIYIELMLYLLAILGVQLTLPGIAGIILSIAMAVDANIIIFERIKEELNSGKMLRTSVESGFKRAFRAIFDSNLTSIIVAIVLGMFGTGPIKGFALTLGIGVAASMFTAITVTRYLLRLMLGLNISNKKLYGLSLKSGTAKEGA